MSESGRYEDGSLSFAVSVSTSVSLPALPLPRKKLDMGSALTEDARMKERMSVDAAVVLAIYISVRLFDFGVFCFSFLLLTLLLLFLSFFYFPLGW